MLTILNYLSLISKGNPPGGETPPNNPIGETPEEFNERYENARRELEQLQDGGNPLLNQTQIESILNTMLNEDTFYRGSDKRQINFEERTLDENGNTHTTDINLSIESFNEMDKKNTPITLNQFMENYREIPLYQRQLLYSFNIGDTGQTFNGGYYDITFHSVNINNATFKIKTNNAQSIEHIVNREVTNAVDHLGLSSNHRFAASPGSSKFKATLEGNKVSGYSEQFYKNSPTYYQQSLAEAVAITKMAKKYGESNTMITMGPNEKISYTDWKQDNREIAQFAENFTKANTLNDLKKLF